MVGFSKLSLFVFTQTIISAVYFKQLSTSATSICSNSFRFDQLCPDPRFGSREPAISANLTPDTNIQLNNNNNRRSYSGPNGRPPSSSSGTYTSSMLIKDSSASSCDFLLNGVETAVITGVHVTENPWDFRHANTCNHIVKLSYDLFEGGQLGGNTGKSSSKVTFIKKDRVCETEIGIRRLTANDDAADPTHHDAGNDEELAKKLNVYFWHNFTLYGHSAEFVDTITNYHLSTDDIACTGPRNGQYVQIAIVISKSGRCEIIVQQYKIELNRSPWGCSAAGYPIPFPIQFCGSYECSQGNSILTGLKLLSRRVDRDKHDSRPIQPRSEIHIKTKGPPKQHHQYDYSDETDLKGVKHNEDSSTPLPPCSTTTMSDEDKEEDEDATKRMDWKEAAFLSAFPMCGVLFIIIVLNILRSRSAREICRGYPYPYPRHSMYQGSCNSIDKSTLPM